MLPDCSGQLYKNIVDVQRCVGLSNYYTVEFIALLRIKVLSKSKLPITLKLVSRVKYLKGCFET